MKKPIVLNGNGDAPKAVPSSEAINTFQPRENSPVPVRGATVVSFMVGKHTVPAGLRAPVPPGGLGVPYAAMKIVILGAGQVGRTAAYQLAREEANEVTVVDTNETLLRDLQDRLDIRTVCGNASYPTILEAAGAKEADILVALTSSDETNMMACEVAYTLYRTPTKIARIRSAEYTRHAKLFSAEALSVDVWISPEQLVTEYIERLIRYPGALQVLDFADGRVRLVGLSARKGGLLVGQALRNLRAHIPNTEGRVVAIYRNGRSVLPTGDTVIEDGDEVFFLAAKDDIKRFMIEMRKEEKPVRRVVIAGGGHIGFALAKQLEKSNQVKLIERDPMRARRISEQLESAIVLEGDAADEELLIEENIDSCDVFCALTNSEEANILSAMLAKRLGAAKVMALINKPSYAELMQSGSIDVAISPQTITIGSLLAHVRRGDVVRVHSLRRGAAEALETIIHGDHRSSRVVGKRIEEIELPEGAAIGCIVRGTEVFMAHHDTVVQADDHVVLFITDRRHVDRVERLFLGETSGRR
jgi:trk system potassium uptake protein TrkA